MFRAWKYLLVALVVVAVAASVYALAANNTVPASRAGEGHGDITGYLVTNIAYVLDGADPAVLDAVEFDLDAAAEMVTVKLIDAGATWYTCTNTAGFHWSCDTLGVSINLIDVLRVVAVESIP